MARITIKEAARRLGVADTTIRNRLHRGSLVGAKVPSPYGSGMMWLVELPDDTTPDQHKVIEKDPTKLKVLELVRDLISPSESFGSPMRSLTR